MMVYGIAKKPSAPAPNTSAGTAMNVYAVYRSPPSRNQVTSVPKRRPPSPHSCSWSRLPARQREATKPSTVTSPKSRMKTISAGQLTIGYRDSRVAK